MQTKKLLAALLSAAMAVTAAAIPVFADEAAADPWNGTEVHTEWYDSDANAKEFTISTAADLAGLAKLVNEETDGNMFYGKTVTLTQNIDLGEHSWTPIGDGSHPFRGTFDGGDKTVSNLQINSSDVGRVENLGLFGNSVAGNGDATRGVEIKNLTVDNVNIAVTDCNYWARIGVVSGIGTHFTNCHVTGNINIDIKGSDSAQGVGGIAGQVFSGAVTDCTVGNMGSEDRGTISAISNTGGIIGWSDYGQNITNCHVYSMNIYSQHDVGGIIGRIQGSKRTVDSCSVEKVKFAENENSAADAYYPSNAGGLVGRAYADGSVVVKDSYVEEVYVGGNNATNGMICGNSPGKYTDDGAYYTDDCGAANSHTMENGGPFPFKVEKDGGETSYMTFEEAYDACEAEGTITLANDAKIANPVMFEKDVTIDLQGHNLDMTAEAGDTGIGIAKASYTVKAAVKITDSSNSSAEGINLMSAAENHGTVKVHTNESNNYGVFFVINSGSVKFDNVNVESDGFNAFAMLYSTGGPITISNSTVDIDGSGTGQRFIYVEGDDDTDITLENSDVTVKGITSHGIEVFNEGTDLEIKGDSNVTIETNDGTSGIQLDSAVTYNAESTSTINATIERARSETDPDFADGVKLIFMPTDSDNIYDIVIEGAGGKNINRLTSAQFKFTLDNPNMSYTLVPAENVSIASDMDDDDAYVFHFNDGEDDTLPTDVRITIGQVVFGGYGEFTFAVDGETGYANKVEATSWKDNIVREYTVGGDAESDPSTGKLDLDGATVSGTVSVVEKTLTVNVMFPNKLADEPKNVNMSINIKGGVEMKDGKLGAIDKTINLDGTGNDEGVTVDGLQTGFEYSDANGYQVNLNLPAGYRYTLTFKGDGYRTYTKDVVVSDDTTVTVWNNVMDEKTAVVSGSDPETTHTFLAGDIDNSQKIDLYDLSADVAYFGKTDVAGDFVRYDLNRDGAIDSKDIAMVLVSWNN